MKLSSPYDMLSALPKKSPRGQAVNLDEQGQFLRRGLALKTTDKAESEFWLKWAARSLLTQPPTSTALTALGVIMVRGAETPGSVAAGRLIWEIAALSGDCEIIGNLARPHLGANGKIVDADAAAQWRDRAKQAGCPADK